MGLEMAESALGADGGLFAGKEVGAFTIVG